MRSFVPRPRRLGILLIAATGFVVGLGYRAFVDEAGTHDFANYWRSGLHGLGIGLAAWLVQTGFASNARSSLGAALRRLPVLAELVARALVMTTVIVIAGVLLEALIYEAPLRGRWLTPGWISGTLPSVVLLGLALSLVIGAITEGIRVVGGPMLGSIVLGTYHRPTREYLIVMFLDLADSTRLAESMGELRVHDLITRFFFDIEEP